MPARGFVAAVDFGGTKVAAASATLSGEIIDQVRFDTDAAGGAEQAVQRAVDTALSLISAAEDETGGRCAAAGVVSPGSCAEAGPCWRRTSRVGRTSSSSHVCERRSGSTR